MTFRTLPRQSFQNAVERQMSLPNITEIKHPLMDVFQKTKFKSVVTTGKCILYWYTIYRTQMEPCDFISVVALMVFYIFLKIK